MGNIWRVTMIWKNTTNGTFAQNVLHFDDLSSTKTPEVIAALIDDNWWGAGTAAGNMRSFTTNNVRLDGMSLQNIAPGNPSGAIPVTGQLRSGAVGNTQFHVCLGLVFTLKDGGAGRSHRGRFYHYGVPDGMVTKSGLITGNFASQINPWIAAVTTKFLFEPTTGLRLVLRHRTGPLANTFTNVTDIRCAPTFGVQRRRNFGVGV